MGDDAPVIPSVAPAMTRVERPGGGCLPQTTTLSGLDKARRLVAGHACFVGPSGIHREHMAAAVAEGIALSREEGLDMAAQAVAEAKTKQPDIPNALRPKLTD